METDETQWMPPSNDTTASEITSVDADKSKPRKKRGVIVAESYDAERGRNFTLPVHPKSEESMQVIRAALGKGHFLFASLSADQLEQIAVAMSGVDLSPGETIIEQGAQGDNFYVVESGTVDIFVHGSKVASRGPGDSFGELALLYNSPRAATVVAATPAHLWALDRVTFRYMIASSREGQVQEIISSLRKVPLLESLSDSQLQRVADAVQVVEFRPQDVIIRKGDQGERASTFYMIKAGSVMCENIGEDKKTLPIASGGYFGERALLLDEARAADVVAQERTTCMVLNRKAFNDLLGPLREVLDYNLGLRVITALPLFSKLSEDERKRVASRFRPTEFAGNTVICEENQQHVMFYVVKTGKVKITGRTGGASPTIVGPGDSFGEDALTGSGVMRYRAEVVEEGTQCLVISRVAFEAEVGSLEAIQSRTEAPGAADGAAAGAGGGADQAARVTSLEPARAKKDIRYEDLESFQTLGVGTFGRVRLVRHRETKTPYALKMLQKAQVVANEQQQNVMNERNIMMALDHPFILKLETTFKDRDCLYMLLEFVQGGELFTLLYNQPQGRLSSDNARFYAACVVSALHCMHKKHVAYRDLKPENMLIDREGYIKIVDLGFAKEIRDRSYTLCGTPEYLAPELMLGKGHHQGVDCWAVGVLIYEMLCGVSPFADESGDQMRICRKIARGRFKFPSFLRDLDARDIISRLLESKVTNRLGCKKGGMLDVIHHRWLQRASSKRVDPVVVYTIFVFHPFILGYFFLCLQEWTLKCSRRNAPVCRGARH